MRAIETYAGARFEPSAPRGHVESYFLKANDPSSQRAIWLKWTIFARSRLPRAASADVWAVAFGTEQGHVAVKASVPFEAARFDPDRMEMMVDGCTLDASSSQKEQAAGWGSVPSSCPRARCSSFVIAAFVTISTAPSRSRRTRARSPPAAGNSRAR
ncbi:MAG: hypothetical protein ABIP39_06685, partial [Polyangiaceae bacterium]